MKEAVTTMLTLKIMLIGELLYFLGHPKVVEVNIEVIFIKNVYTDGQVI